MITTHYFSKLNKQQQACYFSIEAGLKSLAPSFNVPLLEGRDIFDIHFLLRLDHPEVFYSSGIKYKYYDNSSEVEVKAEYLFDKKKVNNTHKIARTWGKQG